jgi:hypothetical protein
MCTNTTVVPVTNNLVCSNGTAPVNGSCAVTVITPSDYMCSNGSAVAYPSLCPHTTVYVAPQPVAYPLPVTPVSPVNVKFNNVVTSIATQITNTSGRCNGIGLIGNSVPSTGWFEYGDTANLGRTTASASIGRSATAPFSNVLANLKPTTKYYCRAVMQNQYGIVKGEIVSFVTKSKAVSYVKTTPVVKPITKTVKKTTTKTNQLVCVDGTYISVKDTSASTLLAKGEKLVSLQVEKQEGKLMANADVTYKVSYKNLSDVKLTGVLLKVMFPSEINVSSTTSGVYDEASRTVTLNLDTLGVKAEGSIVVSGKVVDSASIGKTIVVTSYSSYTVPGTTTQDEVTAYVTGSIVPVDSISKVDTGVKKVVGNSSERGFMPNNLVEWLALIAIIFIIFILGRSIYISYKEGEGDGEASGH